MKKLIKNEICKLALVGAAVFCFLLTAAVLSGGISLFSGLVLGFASLCAADCVCRVLLPVKRSHAAQPQRQVYKAGQVPFVVVPGGRAA